MARERAADWTGREWEALMEDMYIAGTASNRVLSSGGLSGGGPAGGCVLVGYLVGLTGLVAFRSGHVS